jgi:hypothetical protein
MDYWILVEPIWDRVSIYGSPEEYLAQLATCTEAQRVLFVMHWTHSEVCNGGLKQYLYNSTGIVAPEAVEAFTALGMPQTAAVIQEAMALLGPEYPRERIARIDALEAYLESNGQESNLVFDDINGRYFELTETENGGIEAVMEAYAERFAPPA